jgi:uncharacterized protein with HEPN domain
MQKADRVRLQHMRDAAQDAWRFSKGRKKDDLDTDRMFLLSLVKCIEIIGEAAGRVTEKTRHSTSTIPWSDIIGMRNRLIHVYYDVNHTILWQTLK